MQEISCCLFQFKVVSFFGKAASPLSVFLSQGDCNVSSLTNQSSFYDPFDDSKHHDAENVANSSILWTMTGRSETNSAFNSFRAILLEPLRGPNGGPVKHDITLQATF